MDINSANRKNGCKLHFMKHRKELSVFLLFKPPAGILVLDGLNFWKALA